MIFDIDACRCRGTRRNVVGRVWIRSTGGARGRTTRRRLWVIALSGALVLASAGVASAASRGGQGQDRGGFHPPRIGHVWTIMLENKSYEATFTGLNQNDFLWQTLPSYGLLLRQYYGTGHFSLDNYISAVSGQAPTVDTQADCPRYDNIQPGTTTADGQVVATSGCVYPGATQTLFDQLDAAHVSWKVYAQDLGKTPTRENAYQCGIPGNPAGAGVPDPGSATAADQYVPKHNPAAWFHSIIDNPTDCAKVVPLNGLAAVPGHPAESVPRGERTARLAPGRPRHRHLGLRGRDRLDE